MDRRDFRRRLERIAPTLRAELRKELPIAAEEIATEQRRRVPEDEGNLKKSIRVEPGRNELELKIKAGGPLTTRPVRNGAKAKFDYALAQEYGVTGHEAQAFFWPGYRFQKGAVKKRSTAALKRAVQRSR